jgi:hypothetical protein
VSVLSSVDKGFSSCDGDGERTAHAIRRRRAF